ncbi:hypothetical protein D6T65_15125 [Arthrobacter frigidicola]|nr:hypothetical protein D6T65_15125 [Arthrobacter frigidicola]
MAKLERFTVPGVEAQWSPEAVGEVAEEIEERHSGDPVVTTRDSDMQDDIAIRLAQVQPSAGVIAAFIELERDVASYLTAMGVDSSRGGPIITMRRAPDVSPELKKLVDRLARLRNGAAHGQSDITYDSALEYIRATEELGREIRQITEQQKTRGSQK